MRVLFLLGIAIDLFATMILNINVQKSPNEVDLLLNFDIPYEGKIIEKRAKDRTILLLKDVKILAPWHKKLDSFIYQLDILPTLDGSKIVIYSIKKFKLKALRSKDGFSLKISLQNPSPPQQKRKNKSTFLSPTLLYWIGGIIGGVLILYILLKILFSTTKPKATKKIVVEPPQEQEFAIKFEKLLDEHNKIALISYKGIDYLVIIGSNNLLLGKYKEGEIATYEEFEHAICAQDIKNGSLQEDEIFMTIEEYKRKASGNF